jgi:hypothetical protein
LDHLHPEALIPVRAGYGFVLRASRWVYERLTESVHSVKHSQNKFSENPSVNRHIFNSKEGHIPVDTTGSRAQLLEVCQSGSNYLGRCSRGHDWYAKTIDGGRQIWVKVRNGTIESGGINSSPREFNALSGLSKDVRPW